LRVRLVETVSRTGGHLAPSLGVVELTIGLLRAPRADRRQGL
jgi:1-deoxy-D-xylulose-5-phosphate synthase